MSNSILSPETESWKPIEGLPQGYDVSDLGRIRSWREKYKYMGKRGWGWRVTESSHIVHSFPDRDGYLLASIDQRLTSKLGYKPHLHQLVARHFVTGYSRGLQVNHKNLIKTDNRAANLEWVTAEENRRHAAVNHAHLRGEQLHLSKMTESQVREIRALRASGVGTKDIAAMFGLERSSVKRIVNRRTWKHVT